MQGYSFTFTAEREIARDVKEKLCHIGVDHGTELKSTADIDKEKTYELPDGKIIAVDTKRFLCSEVLSQTSFNGKKSQRIPRHFFPEHHEE